LQESWIVPSPEPLPPPPPPPPLPLATAPLPLVLPRGGSSPSSPLQMPQLRTDTAILRPVPCWRAAVVVVVQGW
jgi:hypothetical protein